MVGGSNNSTQYSDLGFRALITPILLEIPISLRLRFEVYPLSPFDQDLRLTTQTCDQLFQEYGVALLPRILPPTFPPLSVGS